MTVIDLTEQIDDICGRYPKYWLSDEARHELQALWGGADCNDSGVFERDETIRINLDGTNLYGEVHIAVARNGCHAISTSHWYGQGGGGSSPSVWNRVAYTTRDEAVETGIKKLIATFEGVRDSKVYAPQNQSDLAARMIQALKTYLSQSRQLSFSENRQPVRCPQQRGSSAPNSASRFPFFSFSLVCCQSLAQFAGPAAVVNGRPRRVTV